MLNGMNEFSMSIYLYCCGGMREGISPSCHECRIDTDQDETYFIIIDIITTTIVSNDR